MVPRRRFLKTCTSFISLMGLNVSYSDFNLQQLVTKVYPLDGSTLHAAAFLNGGPNIAAVLSKSNEQGGFRVVTSDLDEESGASDLTILPRVIRCYSMAVSPAGNTLALAVRIHDPGLEEPYKSVIYIVDAQTGRRHQEILLRSVRNPVSPSGMKFTVGWKSQEELILAEQGDPQLYRISLSHPEPVSFCDYTKQPVRKEALEDLLLEWWGVPVCAGNGRFMVPVEKVLNQKVRSNLFAKSPRLKAMASNMEIRMMSHTEILLFDQTCKIVDRTVLPPVASASSEFLLGQTVYYRNYRAYEAESKDYTRQIIKLESGEVVADISEFAFATPAAFEAWGNVVAISPNGLHLAVRRVTQVGEKMISRDEKGRRIVTRNRKAELVVLAR
ncbi:MAG: hypothetical protein R3C49_21045 [Planctomycetaceae bacterium]